MTSKTLILCFLVILAGGICTRQALSEMPSATVHLKSSKRVYLRGEPVLVTLTITNDGKKDLPAWIDRVQYHIKFFIRRDREKFVMVDVHGGGGLKLDRYVSPLPPGKSKSYDFRILPNYARRKLGALVFDKPGTYHVKGHYPLFKKSEVKFESNTIQLRIRKPKGVDAKAWAEMDRSRFLFFLQSGIAFPDKGEYPPLTAARLLKKYPASNYRPALHWALQRYTQRNPGWFKFKHLKPEEVQLIKEALAAGGKIEKTSRFSPAVGIGIAVLLASVVTVLIARRPHDS